MQSRAALSLFALVFLAGCTGVTGNAVIKSGDKITLDYTGTLSDGTVFDSSQGAKPLEFTVGNNEMIPGFEAAIIGLGVNSEKTFTLSPAEAYGEYVPGLVFDINRTELVSMIGEEPYVGMLLYSANAVATVVNVSDVNVSIDMNHPLAGKSLTFSVKILSIN